MERMAAAVQAEKEKSDNLLKELMPPTVADALQHGKAVSAREHETVTLVTTDIVSFTTISAMCTPHQVVALLGDLYSRFDRLTELNKLYKVCTAAFLLFKSFFRSKLLAMLTWPCQACPKRATRTLYSAATWRLACNGSAGVL